MPGAHNAVTELRLGTRRGHQHHSSHRPRAELLRSTVPFSFGGPGAEKGALGFELSDTLFVECLPCARDCSRILKAELKS